MTEDFMQQLEIFHGSATAAQARVYARLPKRDFPTGAKLTGTIAGPTCLYSETLSATMRFVDRGPGDTILAEAVIPDPCFWTPQLPFLYQVTLQLRERENVLAECRREFGIRQLGTRGKHLFQEGKRHVLRGAWTVAPEKLDLKECHAEGICIGTPNGDKAFFTEASKAGVLVVAAGIPQQDSAQSERHTWLSQFAAVGAVYYLPGADAPFDPTKQFFTANVLRTQYIGEDEDSTPLPFAEVVIAEMADPQTFGHRFADCLLPVIVKQSGGKEFPPSEVRAACDKLQARMAPYGEYSGFLV